MTLVIREEQPADGLGIDEVITAAFGRRDEAELVQKLREEGVVLLSAVAGKEADRIAGHVLFSRMWIDTPERSISAVSLAPLSVLPSHQRRGIGGHLVQYGLEILRQRGERIVIVVGHPAYYPRCGFSAEAARALAHPFPPGVLMAMELQPGALRGVRGNVRYPEAFGI